MTRLLKIRPDVGWMLVCPDEANGQWYIAWRDLFRTKKLALAFAAENGWAHPYRAVKGTLRALASEKDPAI